MMGGMTASLPPAAEPDAVRARAHSFNAAAAQYAANRPSYPPALFDAIVTESWSTADEDDPPPAGNVVDGLGAIGRRYAELLSRPQMTDLFRIVIAELPRFPELARAQFSHGKMPYFESVRDYLLAEHEAGTVRIEDVDLAATQFLGMISNYVFWPTLLVPGWEVSAERVAQVVDEAVRTIAARYAVTGPGASTND